MFEIGAIFELDLYDISHAICIYDFEVFVNVRSVFLLVHCHFVVTVHLYILVT